MSLLDDLLDELAALELQAAEEELTAEQVIISIRSYVINYD